MSAFLELGHLSHFSFGQTVPFRGRLRRFHTLQPPGSFVDFQRQRSDTGVMGAELTERLSDQGCGPRVVVC